MEKVTFTASELSSRRCFRSKCHNFRSERKEKSSKEQSRRGTKEPKKRLVQMCNLYTSYEAKPNSNDENRR
ncbi:hypothetical protein KFK09_002392 [Dendrobium nobile]|uniref:Uncharacterized protein n=1 Tax=Dendrobium nobile TaxID=94219 RepID=A0A8T3C1A3_DENNO|nr:hypothetical protein KFK09_002392 [Dendrobium nobile]